MTSQSASGVSIFPLTLKQGADASISMTWLDDNGNPINLTGFSMKLSIRQAFGSASALLTMSSAASTGSRIVLGGVAGTINLIFARADTAGFTPGGLTLSGASYGLGVYDLQYTDPSGNVGYLLEGSVSLDPQVTV